MRAGGAPRGGPVGGRALGSVAIVELALYGTAAALIAVAFQFADAGTGWHDLRRAHSGGLRLNPAAWTVPLAAVAAVGVLVGIGRVVELLRVGETLPRS